MRNWKDTLIAPTASILQALEKIDTTALQIALVVGENNSLLGTVTDGDIRRGILKGLPLERPVQEIMHRTPTVARLNDSRENILALMKLKTLSHIPVIDDQNRVVGLEIFAELMQSGERDNWVVLMAGGLGSRLQPLTQQCPKPLIHVGNKPILETILENFLEYGFRRFYFSVNYKAEMIEDYFGDGSRWGAEIHYIHEEKPLGTAGPLGCLPTRPTAPVLVMNGDILTRVNFQQFLDFHEAHRSLATMCVREYEFQVPYGVVRLDQHRVIGIEEKPLQRFFVSAGIYALDPAVLEFIPPNTSFDMPQLFNGIIERQLETAAFPIREYWLDIGRMDDLERAKLEYAEVFK